jgi:alpha-L-rhamnosidase
MKRWWLYLDKMAIENILYFSKYGDWVPPGRVRSIKNCPPEIISTWILYRDAEILARVARTIGRENDARCISRKGHPR